MNSDKQPVPSYRWQMLSATALKLIAVVLMFFDHIHQMFVSAGAPLWLTMLGRPVFPIFLFVAAESFHYTRSKKNYLLRLLFASWGMTVFTLVLQLAVPNENAVLMNNAFSTFFIAAFYMLCWDWFADGVKNKSVKKISMAVCGGILPIISLFLVLLLDPIMMNEDVPLVVQQVIANLMLMIPNVLFIEGGIVMAALGVLFYIFREHRFAQVIVLLLVSLVSYFVDGGIQWMMCFAAIPMLLYSGKRGKGLKYFFYIFYPAHIAVLYLISAFVL